MRATVRARQESRQRAGFILVELMCAMAILLIGLMSLGLVMISLSRQQEHARARRMVLEEAQSILEEIRGVAPQSVVAAYQGRTYVVPGVTGNNPDGSAITVSIDDSNPRLLKITLGSSWNVVGQVSSMTLEFEVYASKSDVTCS
jgi:type II secretory pathway pseudopilin PulG